MGDIGKPQRVIEFEPLPEEKPEPVAIPSEPEKVGAE